MKEDECSSKKPIGLHVEVWQKTTKFYKAIILQLKNKLKKYIRKGKKTNKRKAVKKNQYRESNIHSVRVQNEQKIENGEWCREVEEDQDLKIPTRIIP